MKEWIIKKLGTLIGGKYLQALLRRLVPRLTVYLSVLNLDPALIERLTGDLTIVVIALAGFLIELGLSFVDKKKNQK